MTLTENCLNSTDARVSLKSCVCKKFSQITTFLSFGFVSRCLVCVMLEQQRNDTLSIVLPVYKSAIRKIRSNRENIKKNLFKILLILT